MRGGWQRVAGTFSVAVRVARFSEVPDGSLVSCEANFVPSWEASRCRSRQSLAPRRSVRVSGSPACLRVPRSGSKALPGNTLLLYG